MVAATRRRPNTILSVPTSQDYDVNSQSASPMPCAIAWPERGALRIRDVVRRSNHRVTGKFPSIKMGRMLQWESRVELHAFILHECDPAVRAYREQPARISYQLRGEKHWHVPDLFVEACGKKIFREIKTDKDAADPEIKERTDLLSAALPLLGYEYQLFSESQINIQPRLSNAMHALRLGRNRVDLRTRERVRSIFRDARGPITLKDVRAGLFGEHGHFAIFRLVLEGQVLFNFNMCWQEDQSVVLTHI